MTSAFLDYFRCPEEFAKFSVAPQRGPAPGFFRMGKHLTCFGRSVGPVARKASAHLPDAFPLLQDHAEEIVLPFDPDEVLENLRKERYIAREDASSSTPKLVRKAYYVARPFLAVGFRKYFQRFHLRDRKNIRFPSWPIDKSADHLCSDLMSLCVKANGSQRIPFVWFWPDEYQGCVLMTHDVEHEPGRDFCGELMDMDERHGIRSSFQVVPEERYEVSEAYLEAIRSRGFELNVHDLNHDGHLFESHELFLERAKKINAYSVQWRTEGFRAGGMYRNAEWTEAFQFDYDMSFPSAAHLEPQQGGCCTVMPYIANGLVEIPLTTTQDYSLFHILGQYSINLWKDEVASLTASNGLASFIIHPDYVIESRERRVYEELLTFLSESCSRAKLWQPLPRDVARWWRQRSQMRVERSCDSWKVVGPGSERACVAFAEVGDGRLTYHVEKSSCSKTFA